MKRNFGHLRVVGVTPEGLKVLAGVFPIVNSEGVPIDVVISALHKDGYVIDMMDFIRNAKSTGWTARGTFARLEAGLSDAGHIRGAELEIAVRQLTLAVAATWR